MKVLHVNYALERGGIETWLLHLVRAFNSKEFEFYLAYHRGGSVSMATELQQAGVRLLELPAPKHPIKYIQAYRKLLRTSGPFDVVHSHVNFAGLMMLGAKLEKVPVRLVQSHVSSALMTRGLIAGGYTRLTNRFFLNLMTQGIGVSPSAAITLFGEKWVGKTKVTIEPCGLELSTYLNEDNELSHASLGLSSDGFTLAVIGRLSDEKNQSYAIQIIDRMLKNGQQVQLLLIGDGPSGEQLKQQVNELGIEQYVHFLGERSDVPALLLLVDVLLMPSFTEGAPLAVIEAQAAGVPCVVSKAVPKTSILLASCVQLSLNEGVDAWVEAVTAVLSKPQTKGLNQLKNTSFDIHHNVRLLKSLYSRSKNCIDA